MNRSQAETQLIVFGLISVVGCDEGVGFELTLRVTDVVSQESVPNARVLSTFCFASQADCGNDLGLRGNTDTVDGVISIPYIKFVAPALGCNMPEAPGTLVLLIEDTEATERFELVVDSLDENMVPVGNDYVGVRSEGTRFVVEIIECTDVFPPF